VVFADAPYSPPATASTILEIGVGHGRWTKFLLGHCEWLVGVDLSPGCIEYCRRIFDENERRRFIVNDGMSLREIPDSSVDFIFSSWSRLVGKHPHQLTKAVSAVDSESFENLWSSYARVGGALAGAFDAETEISLFYR
jgi:ubiquinone/menaquinone biosynthesis C-methylase UbiE